MKLIILDRDGVINYDSDAYIKAPAEWQPIPGSLEAIAKLTQAGYTVTVATNQSGIARGYYDRATLEQIHQKMQTLAIAKGGRIDSIFFCPHGPDDNCACRKPKPGLLQQIAEHYQIDLQNTPVVGDSLRDLEAALAMQCRPYLVLTGNGQKTKSKLPNLPASQVFIDLLTLVNALVEEVAKNTVPSSE